MNNPDLLTLLERGTRAPLIRAALTLLISLHGLWDREDVVERWYERYDEHGSHPAFAVVRWHVLAADADRGRVPLADGERAALLVAASLACGHRVDLAHVLPMLDEQLYATLTVGLYSVLRQRDPITSEWNEIRFEGQEQRGPAADLPHLPNYCGGWSGECGNPTEHRAHTMGGKR